MKSDQQPVALLADIGGTHARFAVLQGEQILETKILTQDSVPGGFADCAALCRHYLDAVPPHYQIARAAWAVAGPVTQDVVTLTNRGWSFSQRALQDLFGWDEFIVVNDFAALALSLPHLTDADKILLKPGLRDGAEILGDANAPLAVVGPGTGLGVAGLVPLRDGGWHVLPGEGGHVVLPTVNDAEAAILHYLQKKLGLVAAEHVLSGRGLVYLAQAMQADAVWQTPQEIAAAALATPPDPQALAVVAQFCAFLGTVAGDAALTLGARGGVYLAGGVLPKMIDLLQHSAFSTRFVEKYAVKAYLQAIPVWLITHPLPAFVGLQALLHDPQNKHV